MLESLEVRAFRNLQPATLELGTGSHLILGDNGAGKTSWLEAIYVLTTTRSFRASRLADCVRHGEQGFFLAGETSGRIRLEMAFEAGESFRRVNGNRASLSEHLAAQPVVAWTTAELEVLLGPPSARRRFLDRGIVGLYPGSLDLLSRYRRALAEKRRLLQSEALRGPRATILEMVEPWNLVLAEAAAGLAERRALYVRRSNRALLEVVSSTDLGLPPIELRYRPSPATALDGAEAIARELEAGLARELATGQPAKGPHRDELEIAWDGHPVRKVASAGERKAVGLALVAAHGQVLEGAGIEPVYLLDDVDTELDASRLAGLWRHFANASQVVVSSNRPMVWEGLEIDREWVCEEGVASRRTR